MLDPLSAFFVLLVSLVLDAFADREGSIHPSIRRIFTSPYILAQCFSFSLICQMPGSWLADLLERANSWAFLHVYDHWTMNLAS